MTESALGSRFGRSVAVVVGIDKYESGIPPLRTAANDARRLATMLADQHGFEVRLFIDEDASHERLLALLTDQLPEELGPDDRLILYFAGHGVALDGDDGPNGYLLPQDARRGEESSYLFMPLVHDALLALPVRHALIIMDSCFSGAFRWAATRNIVWMPEVVHEERFDRFVNDPAWQVITSTAHDQEAMDQLSSGSLGTRPEEDGHSPFALALFEALEGKGDIVPADGGDGLITATELFLYLENRLQPETMEQGSRQTPGLWPLSRHDKGEFVFAVPGQELNLPPAPALNLDNNPYRGLESYDREHAELFFGRKDVIDDLEKRVETETLTVVLGASGTGKSSVVKAGLLPRLDRRDGWHVLPTVRPGRHPLVPLGLAIGTSATTTAIKAGIEALCEEHPRTILFIDQFEELVTMTHSQDERETVLKLLRDLIEDHSDKLEIIVTLRTDFEPQFSRGELEAFWADGRYVIPPMTQDDLRACILNPATARVMYFKPNEVVDELINEVVATPGGLPLLSFALSEMFIHYLGRGSDDRAIEREDYEAVGGVVGALRARANAEYEALDPDHRETMRLMMLRMVASGSGSVARRRVLRSELEFDSELRNSQVKTIVDRLVAARLIVMGNQSTDDGPGEDYVEPAHDALVRAWGRLLHWVHRENEQDPDDLRFQRRLSMDAEAWDGADAKKLRKAFLWDDPARSASLRKLSQRGAEWLNRREQQFARKSVIGRRRIRQGVGAVFLFVLALGAVALWQALVAVTERDRAVARGLETSVETQLGDGNLFRAVQIARGMQASYPNAPSAESALLSIAAYPSAELRRYQMPASVTAEFAADDRWLIIMIGGLSGHDVQAVNRNGVTRSVIDPILGAEFSSDGRWFTAEIFAPARVTVALEGEVACQPHHEFSIFDLASLDDAEVAGREFSITRPVVGGKDGVFAYACESTIFAGRVRDLSDTAHDASAGFDTGANVERVYVDADGRVVAEYLETTRVYSVDGELLLAVEGTAPSFDDGFVATLVGSNPQRIRIYGHKGEFLRELEGTSPVISAEAGRVAFERSGPDGLRRTAVTHLKPVANGATEEHLLANGNPITFATDVLNFDIEGTDPRFSPDGSLILTTIADQAQTAVWDAQSGRRLFTVAGIEGRFAHSSPILLTIVDDTRIRLWDMRRVPTGFALRWGGARPKMDIETQLSLERASDTRCQNTQECESPDGRVRVLTAVSSMGFGAYTHVDIQRNAAADSSDTTGTTVDADCGEIRSLSFSATNPWVLLACDNGIEIRDLDGNLVRAWSAEGDGRGAMFSGDEGRILSFRGDNSLWIHDPADDGSVRVGSHDSLVVAANTHASGAIAAASNSGQITLYDSNFRQTHSMTVPDGIVDKLVFSPDGDELFARTDQDLIYRFTLMPNEVLEEYAWVEHLSEAQWTSLIE